MWICVEQIFVWNLCAIASLYFSHVRVTKQDAEEISTYIPLLETTQVIVEWRYGNAMVPYQEFLPIDNSWQVQTVCKELQKI